MKNKDRREFIKLAGTALLVTSGISVFGLVVAKPKKESEESGDEYFSDGYYDDGYYDDGYYDDGYYDDGYATGLNEIRNDSIKLVVAPNPSDGNFELTFNSKSIGQSTILINDLSGKTIVQKNFLLQHGDNRMAFESNMLARGIYELQVKTEQGFGRVRLMIVK